jgi:putative heme transporter
MVWRVALLLAAALVVGAVLWRFRIVTMPVFVAVLLCTALTPPVVRLERWGWPTLLATWTVFLSAIGIIVGSMFLILPPTIAQFDGLGEAVSDGLRDVEDWLIDGPLGLEGEQVREYTQDPLGRLAQQIDVSSEAFIAGARTLGELAVGAVLALVLTFLFLKDGRRFQAWMLDRMPARHAPVTRGVANRAWNAFGGFLRGAAILGVVEGIAIGTTVHLVGAPLAVPIAVLTFFGAFFPIVGAVLAGAVATLVTLTTVGTNQALIVLIVTIVVQQFDSDLLAPVIYGRALQLHPATVLIALTAGGTIGGIIGAFIAVPMVSAVAGGLQEVWQHRSVLDPPGSEAGLLDEERSVVNRSQADDDPAEEPGVEPAGQPDPDPGAVGSRSPAPATSVDGKRS